MLSSLFGRLPHEAEINGKVITVKADETILTAALRQDVIIPSICRVGGCGTCKCKLKDGKVQELTESAYLLSEKEISDGFILACQSRLRSNVKIEVDLEGALEGTPVKGTIVGKTMLTHDIARIDIELAEPIHYRAGQFAEVTLSGLPDFPRSYSFSTAPGDNKHVSFTVRRVPGGRVSGQLVDKARVGESLTVRGPGGQFWVRPGKEPVLMVAGGSGLAPILAMLQDMKRHGDLRPVTVLFGARSEKDLYALEDMASHVSDWPEFRFIPILSEADPAGTWNGLTGLVTEHIPELIGAASSAYLCGPPAMIDAAVAALRKCGISEDKLHADRFVDQAPKTHTGFYGAVGLPEVERVKATVTDYLKFFVVNMVGIAGVVSILAGGAATVLGFLLFVVFYVGGDMLLGDDTRTPEYGAEGLLTLQVWLTLPLTSLIVFSYLWTLSPWDPLGFGAWISSLTGYDILAAREASGFWHHLVGGVHVAILIGFVGTTPAHELTHRTWEPVSKFIGRWLLAFSFDVGFAIEHVYGHHRYVSTEHDPATAPRGRSVYYHIVASTIEGNISAWRIEAERLKRKHSAVLSYKNAYIRGLLMSALLVAIAGWMVGWTGVFAFSACALGAKALLEIVNYMEHYGIVRLPDQAVQPRHSWNTNARMTSWGMINLGRHSHHHAQGEVPYQNLMPFPDAPRMIGGYLSTVLLTLVPPLWHKLMIPKLMDWDKRYASPEERVLALRANQRSGLKELRNYDPCSWNTAKA
ncbi:Xylene monooxygenase electron transfer component [Pseudomonas extremaustralis]|uniref:Xylene monooxygenase electron transfer component n=1 Tax=Pseudomonas extremaustralis TaxID=359110 RepID=A0A5M9J2D1_9PSED|nr:fatty acid desaturase [Pseudomonas extremaustralis]KAA8562807.1 Xylene monooxygenase electron transfer component [Pseudomonas extremaustralis]